MTQLLMPWVVNILLYGECKNSMRDFLLLVLNDRRLCVCKNSTRDFLLLVLNGRHLCACARVHTRDLREAEDTRFENFLLAGFP